MFRSCALSILEVSVPASPNKPGYKDSALIPETLLGTSNLPAVVTIVVCRMRVEQMQKRAGERQVNSETGIGVVCRPSASC